jgi:hypothetical protein
MIIRSSKSRDDRLQWPKKNKKTNSCHKTLVMNILAIRFNSAWMVNAKFLVDWFQMQFQLSAKYDLENNEVFNRTQF